MSDTVQYVIWALAQTCRVRQGDGWQLPQNALEQVSDLQLYSFCKKSSLAKHSCSQDVCVTGVTLLGPDILSKNLLYPSSGMVVSSTFVSYGGLDAVEEMCKTCPANTRRNELAGCAGWFYLRKTDPKGDAQLKRIIYRLGLSEEVERLFPKTSIQWYGFWIKSPLSREATAIMLRILEAVRKEDRLLATTTGDAYYSDSLDGFIKALRLSLRAGKETHVRLSPPGHANFGNTTIHGHCPRCKHEAPIELWARNAPDQIVGCAVCGERYSPKATYSFTRDPDLREKENLSKLMGVEAHRKFAIKYLMSQELSESFAIEEVERYEKNNRERKEQLERDRELSRRSQVYVQQHILSGLNNISKREESGDPEWLLSVDDFRVFLERCREQNLDVFYIHHVSEVGDRNQLVTIKHAGREAISTFDRLVTEGLNEKFTANVLAPEEVVDAWWQAHGPKQGCEI